MASGALFRDIFTQFPTAEDAENFAREVEGFDLKARLFFCRESNCFEILAEDKDTAAKIIDRVWRRIVMTFRH